MTDSERIEMLEEYVCELVGTCHELQLLCHQLLDIAHRSLGVQRLEREHLQDLALKN
jgi:hypothetical protein